MGNEFMKSDFRLASPFTELALSELTVAPALMTDFSHRPLSSISQWR
jgi:hypothetical protein